MSLLLTAGCAGSTPPEVTTTVTAAGEVPDDGSDVAIDGVVLVAPDQLTAASTETGQVRADAEAAGLDTTLVMSNYLPISGRYEGGLARAMLADPEASATVISGLVDAASGFDAVQVSLLKLASSDSAALVDFVAGVRDALPDEVDLLVAVTASTDFGGYRERGTDLEGLTEHADRLVLQTYEPAEVGLPATPIDDVDGLIAEIDYATSVIDADRIDLGISPLAGADTSEGLKLATDAGLHGMVVGSTDPPVDAG